MTVLSREKAWGSRSNQHRQTRCQVCNDETANAGLHVTGRALRRAAVESLALDHANARAVDASAVLTHNHPGYNRERTRPWWQRRRSSVGIRDAFASTRDDQHQREGLTNAS